MKPRSYETTDCSYVAYLPWPPSVNHYFATFKGRRIISKDGRAYRACVAAQVFEDFQGRLPRWTNRLKVEIWVNPPDRRKRDLDNLLKSCLDALQHAGLYEDDSQIDDLHIIRKEMGNGITVGVRAIQEINVKGRKRK